jgi:sec-independent protein translocase protein TatA
MLPQIAGLGPGEIALILAVLVLLFGASKLPELARGSGRALRIFKAETKGLMDDDDEAAKPTMTPEQRELEARPPSLDAESERQAAERRAAEHRGEDPV